ncbi:MAG: hypothetical protein ABSE48_17715 [Verrucomicrobiota bacterium]|jgi:hypothetical protein
MKSKMSPKVKVTEAGISPALLVVLLIFLPLLGGIAMLIGSAIGIVAYLILFPGSFRARNGSARIAMAFAAVAAAAVASYLLHWHW